MAPLGGYESFNWQLGHTQQAAQGSSYAAVPEKVPGTIEVKRTEKVIPNGGLPSSARLDSLPDDLKEIAVEALREKFGEEITYVDRVYIDDATPKQQHDPTFRLANLRRPTQYKLTCIYKHSGNVIAANSWYLYEGESEQRLREEADRIRWGFKDQYFMADIFMEWIREVI